MPSPSYEQNKKHIYEWNNKNYERKKQINNNWKRKHDSWKKISKIYFNILICDME